MLIAVFVGLMIAVNSVRLLEIIMNGLDVFANSVTAVVLFSLGLLMGRQPFGRLSYWLPVLSTLLALLSLPFWLVFLN